MQAQVKLVNGCCHAIEFLVDPAGDVSSLLCDMGVLCALEDLQMSE